LSLIRPVKPGRLEFQVYRPREHRRLKLLPVCFFCGKKIRRKGDLDRLPVLSEGSELKVPCCHSCFLTAKKLRGLPWVTVKARVPPPDYCTNSGLQRPEELDNRSKICYVSLESLNKSRRATTVFPRPSL